MMQNWQDYAMAQARHTHPYTPDPQSGAGNCTCGMAERHRTHPHTYMRAAYTTADLCTCALPPDADCHN